MLTNHNAHGAVYGKKKQTTKKKYAIKNKKH
jgi:hypothetical protein